MYFPKRTLSIVPGRSGNGSSDVLNVLHRLVGLVHA